MNVVADAERRARTKDMIDKLFIERQEMLSLYCQVAGLEPYSKSGQVLPRLQEFCQVLMDYMAFGHLEIYDRIVQGEERRSGIMKVAEEVYPKVVKATDCAVTFNDKYDCSKDDTPDLDELPGDLSVLGEELAVRIEMEDRLVSVMLK